MSSSPEPIANHASSGNPRPPVAFQLPFEPGEVIAGKYRIEKLIGTGGVGFVVAATHVGLDDGVALKFLKPEFATHQEAVTRFTIEARASFKIKNEHVARVLDVDTLADGTPFMVMELLEGRDLRSILETHRYLPIELAVDFALQSCEALAAAHACHIIHRDIKPENLFVTQSGDDDHIKVLDFGISKVALTQQQLPQRKTRATALTMMAVGTPPYMSPEQVRASNDLDARADIWSLGCVLYELVSGTAPFERMSLMQACAAVLEDEPLPLREVCREAPAALDAAVMRCLRKNPAERYADVAELARAIAPFGARSINCAERCAELLAEGVRRSDPGFRPSEAPLRRSTPMRISTRMPPAPPVRKPSQQFPAAQILATTPAAPTNYPIVAQVVATPIYPPDTSVELLTEADLKPSGNRGILLAVGALTLLSVAYLAFQHVERLERTAGVQVTKSEGAAASHVGAASAPAATAPNLAAPQPTAAVAPVVAPAPVSQPAPVPAAAPIAQAVVAPAAVAAPTEVAPVTSRPAPVEEQAPRAQAPAEPPVDEARGVRHQKPILKVSPAKEEDPDVGF